MAYTGILAECGFDLVSKTVEILQDRFKIPKQSKYYFDKEYVFLRDVDIEPIILNSPF
jgi:hypothetical protein